MSIDSNAPIEAILTLIGQNLTQQAKQIGLKKKDLADLADVNQNTITSILRGGDLKVSTLIRVTRVLGDTAWLAPLLETPGPTPLQALKHSGTRLKRKNQVDKPAPRRIGRKFTSGL